MSKQSITEAPAGCSLISARDIRPGDTVRFRNPRFDYVVEEVDTDVIGVRHRWNDGTATCTYHPGELLWITSRKRTVLP